MSSYGTISEIVPEDGPNHVARPPLGGWKVTVQERGFSVDLGGLGSRRDFVANAQVRVTERDGTCWTGLTILG